VPRLHHDRADVTIVVELRDWYLSTLGFKLFESAFNVERPMSLQIAMVGIQPSLVTFGERKHEVPW
jgi:hypothetical protein